MEKIICIILLVLYGVVMLMMCCITLFKKNEKPQNKVHFYVARDKNRELFLYMSKPFRGTCRFLGYKNGCIVTNDDDFHNFGLNKNDYVNLKWEDEPVEVFLNMKD